MVVANDPIKSPEINGQKHEYLFSPRFRSVAAMAGWDEEALLIASLITPDCQLKHKRRSDFKTPPSNSTRKRRSQRKSPVSTPVAVLDLDEDESKSNQESEKIDKKANTTEVVEKNRESEKIDKKANTTEVVEKNRESDEGKSKGSDVSISSPAILCLDRLREELSCAICLEICYEPSTTPCGHSFCKKCLRSAADRCGKKCPKCRQLISNVRYCTVNTVLWNTIQLIFPKEIEARKTNEASASDSYDQRKKQPEAGNPFRVRNLTTQNRVVQALNSPESENRTDPERRNHHHRHRIRYHRSSRPSETSGIVSTRMTALPSQDEDAALALRLQREEFMEAFEGRDSAVVSRANLRAMASSRVHNIRVRVRRE